MNGIIERITIYTAKGDAGKDVSEGRFIGNLGLEGDFHATGGERQISLLFLESRESAADMATAADTKMGAEEKGLCLSRFKANLAIRGLASGPARGTRQKPAAGLPPGARLLAGEAELEITGETKHCHEGCARYEAGNPCALAGLNLFARVAKGGVIRAGDRVESVP